MRTINLPSLILRMKRSGFELIWVVDHVFKKRSNLDVTVNLLSKRVYFYIGSRADEIGKCSFVQALSTSEKYHSAFNGAYFFTADTMDYFISDVVGHFWSEGLSMGTRSNSGRLTGICYRRAYS